MSIRVFLVLLLVSVLGFGCGDDGDSATDTGDDTASGDGDGDGDVTLSGDVQAIFTASCASAACHDAETPAGNLNLSSGAAHASLVGANSSASACSEAVLVVAGDSAGSYLLDKLDGSHDCGAVMPLGGSLPVDDRQTIADWIDAGALDN